MSHNVSTLITHPKGEVISVSVIGAGGTGSLLLSTLARLNQALLRLRGIYLNVRVFDPDRITENNITRQNFSPSDIGLFKSITLVTRLNRFYNTHWYGFPCRWEDESRLTRANIIITCTDTAASRIRLSKKLKKWSETTDHPLKFCYWMDTGNTATTCNVILGGYGNSESGSISPEEWVAGGDVWKERMKRDALLPFVTDRFNLREHEKKNPSPSCSLAESLSSQHIMINDITAKLGALLLWDLLTKSELDWCGVFCNITNLNIKKIKC